MSNNQERGYFEAWLMGSESADEITFEKLRAGDRVFDEYAVKEIEVMWMAWKARAALTTNSRVTTSELKAPESDCPYCNGTGEADSGGTHPWGAPATIPCQCMYEDPFHVHVSKFDALIAERESLRAVNAELLEALVAITNQLERVGDTRHHKDGQFIDDARAAIASARKQENPHG